MKRTFLAAVTAITLLFTFFIQTETKADVFAHNIRVTQPGSNDPFDGRFDDGTGAAIRFTLADRADSLWINIYNGATLVRTITATGFNYVDSAGVRDTFVVWDGNNNSGSSVPTGNYTFEVKTWNSGYATYKTIHYSTPAIFTRGVTTVKNKALKNFGFIFTADNGGYATGVARHAANGEQWGNAQGTALLTTTGVPVGPGEVRHSSEADEDGYIYLLSTSQRKIFRYHTDTLNVVEIDSGYTAAIRGLQVVGTGAGKQIIVVADTVVYRLNIGNNYTFYGQKEVLISTQGAGIGMYDAVAGRDPNNSLYVTFVGIPNGSTKPGLARFHLGSSFTGTKTFADTVWTVRNDTGLVTTAAIYYGATSNDDIIYFTRSRIASGNAFVQGIFAVKDIYNSAAPVAELAFQDYQNNITSIRADVAVDAAGNIVFFENSNEEVIVISRPGSGNTFTTPALNPIKVIFAETIAAVRIDANGDFVPDRLNEVVTVIGVVNSVNFTASSNRFQYGIQDATAGIIITKGSETGGGPVYNIGDRLLVTGTVGHFNGVTQLNLTNLGTDIELLDINNPLTPVELNLTEFIADAEKYESMLVKVNGVTTTPENTVNWPASNADANINIWNGYTRAILRIDRDTDCDGQPAPTYPINVVGLATQFFTGTPANGGYQISPNAYAGITQGVATNPHPYFFLNAPGDDATILVTDSAQSFTANWTKTIDVDGDAVQYQFQLLKTPVFGSNPLNDSLFTFTGTQALGWLGTADTLNTKWTVRARGGNSITFIPSQDTFNIRIIRAIPVGVKDAIPTQFYVDQNYPNPFNPSTTIKFGLPTAEVVDLRIYNMLGQEVAVLANNRYYEAGSHSAVFDATRLASGTYIYRLQAGKSVVTKKMQLLK
ncbi:MAG: T9SS type A sorting domain-containing protein [Ignavibacteriales bacterium]|nr:MAG: T9SS type A sorting domain-containing protein [Ignavibacteriales bacterium]